MEFIAHSANGKGEKHFLKNHLNDVSVLMHKMCSIPALSNLAKVTGILHDLGKYQDDFQKYLLLGGKRGSVPHSRWGAVVAKSFNEIEPSFAIDGHHGGLPDLTIWKNDHTLLDNGEEDLLNNLCDRFENDLKINIDTLFRENRESFTKILEGEVTTRYIFSLLTDADWLDTEMHFDKTKSALRISEEFNATRLIKIIENHISQFPVDGNINKLRNRVRLEALELSKEKTGFFSLNLPTGMGKTLTSIHWALKHAECNNLSKIIIVLPYISIIDQTSEILKDIFGESVVLEHHSNVLDDKISDEKQYDIRKLATENWEYPIIVTTNVQFFETLFSNRPSKMRKFHNIANSVVIFDEVQTLPMNIIEPSLQMLKDINNVLNTSFLFCTATLPAFESRDNFRGIEYIKHLVKRPEEVFEKTKRVSYHFINDLEPVEIKELSEMICEVEQSVLVVVNTKKDANELYHELCNRLNKSSVNLYHLSTNMCPHHRKKTISSVKTQLNGENPVILVSTQLIEAGVDLDFPVVFRVTGPLESVIQVAGRCNREGKLKQAGMVFLFKLSENRMRDKTYNACTSHSEIFIKDDIEKLHSHNTYPEYYRDIVSLYINPDSRGINKLRKRFSFKAVNDSYYIIKDAGEPVYVKEYNGESERLYNEFINKDITDRNILRKMQQYTIQLYPHAINKNMSNISVEKDYYMVWHGEYDQFTGIVLSSDEANDILIV